MNKLKELAGRVVARIKALWAQEPARVVSWTVVAVLFVASQFHAVLDPATVTQYVAIILPILFGTEVVRAKVTPTAKTDPSLNADPSDQDGDIR